MAGYGDKPFGLRDVKLTNLAGTTQVDLPVGRTLSVKERAVTGELSGDDALAAVVAFSEGGEWVLEAGGLSLEAYALMTGRTVASAGTTPNRTWTLSLDAAEAFPYFKIYGKVLGDSTDDVHCKMSKCKLTGPIEGDFKGGDFWVTKCAGIAVDDGSVGWAQFVQNETATTLPTS